MRSRKSLVKEADRVFSLHIRNRGETFGYNHCFTCGAYMSVESIQAGHFVARRYYSVRWHPVNVWPQCNRCNVEKSGNLVVYEAKLVAMFSQEVIDELWELARSGDGVTDHEIADIIKLYKMPKKY